MKVADDDAGDVGRRCDDDGPVERRDHGDAVARALDGDVVLRGDADREPALGLHVRAGVDAERLVRLLVERLVAHRLREGDKRDGGAAAVTFLIVGDIADMYDIHFLKKQK